MNTHGTSRPHPGVTAALLTGYFVLGVISQVVYREGGMRPALLWWYFVGGNVLGITSTALLMGVYARMNINLALVLATSGVFLLTQFVFWRCYHTPLTGGQIAGILLVALGTVLASRAEKVDIDPSAGAPAAQPVAEEVC